MFYMFCGWFSHIGALTFEKHEQARRHARDRRARALVKEEQSKRELRAVQAELVEAEVGPELYFPRHVTGLT